MKNILTKKWLLIFIFFTLTCLPTSIITASARNNNKPLFRTSGRLIIELKTEPLAHQYVGAPEKYSLPGAQRLATGTTASKQHLQRLNREQESFVKRLRNLATDIKVSQHLDSKGNLRENRYRLLFNGLSVDPGTANAETLIKKLEELPEVKAVYPDRAYYPALYSSRDLINAQALWNNPAIVSNANAGRGVKIAIMDGGIHYLAPMFNGSGYQYPSDIPAPGLGDTRNNNGKIIASRAYFRPDDPPREGDENVWPGKNGTSHGVHVAGIAAGNKVTADYLGLNFDISGVAPAAWLMSYRIFYASENDDGGFYTTEGLAALEDIVADGADILNNSWGSGPVSSGGYYDPLDRALINASEAGIFVVMSAGNSGPGLGTSDHPSVNYISVASSTSTASLASGRLSVTAPGEIDPALTNLEVMEAAFGPAPSPGVVSYELITATSIDAGNFEGCSPWSGTPFLDKAVLIQRGNCKFSDKVYLAQQAGATLVIIYNHENGGDDLISMTASSLKNEITIPSIFIKHSDGNALHNWSNTYGSVTRIEMDNNAYQISTIPDRLSDFSSKGPGVGEVLKPDITAPGDDILSQGYTPHANGENRHFGFGQSSGTSMAAPHVAGAAALIRQIHPDWPNSYIKSAIMTTSNFQDVYTHKGLPGQPLDIGAGRLNLSQVTDPGIICQPPSISFGRVTIGKTRSLATTITNVTPYRETYTINTIDTRKKNGLKTSTVSNITFSPANLSLEPGASDKLTLTIDTTGNGLESGDLQGFILLTGSTHSAHLPLWGRIVQPPGKPILLIDNDGSSNKEYDDYRDYYTNALNNLGKSYDVWDADIQTTDNTIPAAAMLSRYPTMIYFTGDNPDSLSDLYGNRLTEYANGGGSIIAMGQDISHIFDNNEIFYSYILGGRAWWDALTNDYLPDQNIIAHNDAPSAFDSIILNLTASGDGAANQFYIDELHSYPWNEADDEPLWLMYRPLLRYTGLDNHEDGTVALGHRALPSLEIPNQPYVGRSIFTTFGLEGVNNLPGHTSRATLLATLLDWAADEPKITINELGSSTVTNKSLQANLNSPVTGTSGTSYRWDFGDGSSYQGPYSNSHRSHTYSQPGNYLVRVEATDSWGNRAIGEHLVTKPNCLYYPHVATVNNWETEICIINTSTGSTISGEFKAYADDGTLVTTLKNVTLSPGARYEVKVGSTFVNPDQIGYIIFEGNSSGTVVGYTKFYCEGIYRVAIPAIREINSGDIFVSHIASNDAWFTGLSLVNVTATARTIFIETDNGLKKYLELAPGQHKALSIRSLFDNQSQPGIQSAVIKNSAGILGLELFGNTVNGKQLSGILLRDRSATEIFYPHVVTTDDWWTGVVAYNSTQETGRLDFTTFNQTGDILSEVSVNLPGHNKFIGSVASLGFPQATAWFKIEANQPMTGFELFGTHNGFQLAGYSGVDISGTKGIFPKLDNEGFTGIAMVNTTSTPTTITLTAYGNDGNMVSSNELQLAGYERIVKVAEELFDSDISSATYISYQSNCKVVGFQLNGSNDGMLLDGLPALR
ncbi:MAG: S8 family serine peptidase [Pseudomonadota bacterium]|nr:S8 family serine peptidase [Pseudomonadota bacterium]